MKPFESSLAQWMEKYISYRCGLGYSSKNLRLHLRAFDRYVCDQKAGIADLDGSFFLELKKFLCQKPATFNAVLLTVRGFFSYLVRCQIVLENPLADMTFGSPTPHSLRHSFAINTLTAIKQRGRSPQNALPVLSAYLGHCKYRYTAVYLKVLDAKHRQAIVDFAIGRQEEL